ncbi:MAG TPA: SRPBCC family protein [Egibacteraceae bacterium]|nr:SRPBCC family protein [Egibacteraceae bacterium]
MARIEATTHIEADPARVWEVLVDWEGQARWMHDARSVEVLSLHREGVDVVVRCRTDIVGGIVVTDDMVTTEWEEPRIVAVRHLGWLIRGIGAFELSPTRNGTHFTWWEEIELPLGPFGEAIGTVAVVPAVRRVFRRSLAAFKRVCESTSVRPSA